MEDIEPACAELRSGHGVVVVDGDGHGDLVHAAEHVTAQSMAFTIRHTSGLVCVALEPGRLDGLRLPPGVSVDRLGAGVSAADRAGTARALANPDVGAEAFRRPGHVFPLRARPGGVLERAGHAEAAVDLCRLAGLTPAGALAELTNVDGTVTGGAQLAEFARRHRLAIVTVAGLARYRMRREMLVRRTASARIPTSHGEFTAVTYVSTLDETEHVAFVHGTVAGVVDVPVRVHTECLAGDVFGSRRCGCGARLDAALAEIGRAGAGVVVYLRGPARWAVDPHDVGPDHAVGEQILRDLGVDSVRPAEARELSAS